MTGNTTVFERSEETSFSYFLHHGKVFIMTLFFHKILKRFRRLIIVYVVPYVLLICLCIGIFCINIRYIHSTLLTTFMFLLSVAGIGYGIWFFHHFFTRPILQMEEIEQKYSLIIEGNNRYHYTKFLFFILDMIDISLSSQYSSKLLQKQAEFDRMKSQINPHFLYNTLDSIRGYALLENAVVTSEMIEKLSRIFRYTISQKNELINLEAEISMLQDYISIQEYRLNNHILLLQNIEGGEQVLFHTRIPKLTLQPFIENAILHGMKDCINDFIITLHVYTTQSALIINIADNGCGMSYEQLAALNHSLFTNEYGKDEKQINISEKKKGSGIAIKNVNARIKLLYGSKYGIVAYSTPGAGASFEISLPLL